MCAAIEETLPIAPSMGRILDLVLGALPSSVLLLERDGRVVLTNRHFLERASIGASDAIGRCAWQLLPEALVTAARLPDKLASVIQSAKPTAGERVSFRGPGLSTRILWYRIAPVPREGRVEAALLIIDDVTALMHASGAPRDLEEERRAAFQALQAEKLAGLGVFVSGIAHELRNPLAICSSAAQLLEDAALSPEETKACLTRIRNGVGRANKVIAALAALSPGASLGETERLSLTALVSAPAALIERQALEQEVRVVLSIPDEPLIIEGGVNSLERAVFALLLNAVQAMPDGGTLRVSVEARGREASIRVEDTGHGIPQEDLARAFDPFFTTRPPGGGPGLGLSLCHAAVTRYGGTVSLESAVGRGTTVVVTLPLASDQEPTSLPVEPIP